MFKKNIKTEAAFSLVEMIVVLFVISVGLIGVLSLVIQNIQSQSLNKDNIIAYQLAQEGIELVRKTRDSNWLASVDWNLNLVDGTYYMDYLDATPNISNVSTGKLYKGGGYYSHDSSGEETSFSRLLKIESIDANHLRVYSIVSWFNRDKTFEYKLETELYDWK